MACKLLRTVRRIRCSRSAPVSGCSSAPACCAPPSACRAKAPRTAGAPSAPTGPCRLLAVPPFARALRSEEHTSELQSRGQLVCRLLLEKKKKLKDNDHV